MVPPRLLVAMGVLALVAFVILEAANRSLSP